MGGCSTLLYWFRDTYVYRISTIQGFTESTHSAAFDERTLVRIERTVGLSLGQMVERGSEEAIGHGNRNHCINRPRSVVI